MGFTSLFECLVKHFKYSEAVAYSRISALKILSAVPVAAQALSSGEVSLTTLSLAQSFIRKQERETGEKVSLEQKVQFLESIKNKSTQEVKKVLAAICPATEFPPDQVHPETIEVNIKTSTRSFSVKSSRYISRKVKRFVLKRSAGRC
ncbi:hypothetical protein D3C87_1640640 [compost metagenome]